MFKYYCIFRGAGMSKLWEDNPMMSDFRGNSKELARQLILDLKCSVCKDVPGFVGVRKNRYSCPKGRESKRSGENSDIFTLTCT